MIEIDGSEGEGGGQMLRSSLSLAVCTQQPFRITNIRANREKPGLLRQHLTAVKAAAAICDGVLVDAELGSRELTFRPGKLSGGDYSFAIGTAGSSTLVLQTVLPPLLMATASSTVRISGGTHNRASPPFDFMQRAFLPLLGRMGAQVDLQLRTHGFYPKGGGEIVASVAPSPRLGVLELHERGRSVRAYAEAYVAAVPINVARRELEVIGRRMRWNQGQLFLRGLPNDVGPGNVLTLTVEHEHVTEVFTGFGERGLRAEAVAEAAADEACEYAASSAPVGTHLADQLLVPMALGMGGSFTTVGVSQHLQSNARVVEMFTGSRVTIEPAAAGHRVAVDVS